MAISSSTRVNPASPAVECWVMRMVRLYENAEM